MKSPHAHHVDQRSARRGFAVGAVVLALIATACGSEATTSEPVGEADNEPVATAKPAPVVAKAGPATVEPITLQLATNDQLDRPGGQIVDRFVKAVATLSDGAITIEPTYQYPSGDTTAWDQKNIEAMQDGTFDLSFARAGAWESSGVDEMKALQLPGVFVNDAQVDAVSTAPVADDILDGLDAADSVGLGLYPENLRHLAVFADGALDADVLEGLTVRVPLQPTVYEWMTAAGAEPLDVGGAWTTQVADGSLGAIDISLALRGLAGNQAPHPAVVTGNVPVGAKFNVLAMSQAAVDELSDDQMALLRQAAEQVLVETIDERPREVDLAELWCDEGVILDQGATTALADIVAASQSVIDEVAADPVAGPILEAVRSAAGTGDVEALPNCAGAPAADPSASLTPSADGLPNGTYRFTLTEEMFAAGGNPAQICRDNCGTWTVVLEDGLYEWSGDWPAYPPADVKVGECCWTTEGGTYEVDGNTVKFGIDWYWDADEPFVLEMLWQTNPDGSLSFEYVSGDPRHREWVEPSWAGTPWIRIGD